MPVSMDKGHELQTILSAESTEVMHGLKQFVCINECRPQYCDKEMMAKLCELMTQTLKGDRFTTEEMKNAQVLLRIIQQVANQSEPHSGLLILIEGGLTEMISALYHKHVFIASLNCVRYSKNENVDNFYEEVLETITGISDSSVAGKGVMIECFCRKFLQVIIAPGLRFVTKMETLKALNSILERCPTIVREKLQRSCQHKELLYKVATSILELGDYEMQVGLTEALFRLTSKYDRNHHAKSWFPTEAVFDALLHIRDAEFETDCRIFLNVVNGDISNTSVISYPCISATFSQYELQKPTDDNYTDFWIDFNLGSKRVSFFCSAESDTQESTDDSMWETIAIWDENLLHYEVKEVEESTVVTLYLKKLTKDLVNLTPEHEDNSITFSFSKKYDLIPALEKTFGKQKSITERKPKVSAATYPVHVKAPEYSVNVPETIVEEQPVPAGPSNMNHNGIKSTNTRNSVRSNSQFSNTKPQLKASVPLQLFITPSSSCVPKKNIRTPNENKGKMVAKNLKEPKTPTMPGTKPKKVKTPLQLVTTGNICNASSSVPKCPPQSSNVTIPIPKTEQRVGPLGANKSSKEISGIEQIEETKINTLTANTDTVIPSSIPDDTIMCIPDSQPVLDIDLQMLPGLTKKQNNKKCGNKQDGSGICVDVTDANSIVSNMSREERIKNVSVIQTRLQDTDPNFTAYKKNAYKVSTTPSLSTVSEESSSYGCKGDKAGFKKSPLPAVEESEECCYFSEMAETSIPTASDMRSRIKARPIRCCSPTRMSPDSTSQGPRTRSKVVESTETTKLVGNQMYKSKEKQTDNENDTDKAPRTRGRCKKYDFADAGRTSTQLELKKKPMRIKQQSENPPKGKKNKRSEKRVENAKSEDRNSFNTNVIENPPVSETTQIVSICQNLQTETEDPDKITCNKRREQKSTTQKKQTYGREIADRNNKNLNIQLFESRPEVEIATSTSPDCLSQTSHTDEVNQLCEETTQTGKEEHSSQNHRLDDKIEIETLSQSPKVHQTNMGQHFSFPQKSFYSKRKQVCKERNRVDQEVSSDKLKSANKKIDKKKSTPTKTEGSFLAKKHSFTSELQTEEKLVSPVPAKRPKQEPKFFKARARENILQASRKLSTSPRLSPQESMYEFPSDEEDYNCCPLKNVKTKVRNNKKERCNSKKNSKEKSNGEKNTHKNRSYRDRFNHSAKTEFEMSVATMFGFDDKQTSSNSKKHVKMSSHCSVKGSKQDENPAKSLNYLTEKRKDTKKTKSKKQVLQKTEEDESYDIENYEDSERGDTNCKECEDDNDADVSSNGPSEFAKICQSILNKTGARVKQRNKRTKRIDYKEPSESEFDETTMETLVPVSKKPFGLNNHHRLGDKKPKRRHKSVFSETDDTVDTRSEVSWLNSTARKKKPKLARDYTHRLWSPDGRRPRLCEHKSKNTEDVESGVEELEINEQIVVKQKKTEVAKRQRTFDDDHGTDENDSPVVNSETETEIQKHSKTRNRSDKKNPLKKSKTATEADMETNENEFHEFYLEQEAEMNHRVHMKTKNRTSYSFGTKDTVKLPPKFTFTENLSSLKREKKSSSDHSKARASRTRNYNHLSYQNIESNVLPTDDISIEEFRFADTGNAAMDEHFEIPFKIKQDGLEHSTPICDNLLDGSDDDSEKGKDDDAISKSFGIRSDVTHISDFRTPRISTYSEIDYEEDLIMDPIMDFMESGPVKKHKTDIQMVDDDEYNVASDIEEDSREDDEVVVQETTFKPRCLFNETSAEQTRKVRSRDVEEGENESRGNFDKNDELSGDEDDELNYDIDIRRRTGITSLIHSFGSEINKSMMVKKKNLEQRTGQTVRLTQRHLTALWKDQSVFRNKMVKKLGAFLTEELDNLRKDIDKRQEVERRVMVYFEKELKCVHSGREAQEERQRKIQRRVDLFFQETDDVDEDQLEQQNTIRDKMRQEILTLQKKLLQDTQRQEICNVKRSLQSLFV